jgi:hypothetical protein
LLSKVKEDTRLFNSPVVMPLLKLTLPLFFLELFFGGANGLVVFNPAGITAGKAHEVSRLLRQLLCSGRFKQTIRVMHGHQINVALTTTK